MAKPFTQIPVIKQGFFSNLLKKAEPDLARVEVNNLLASAMDVRDLTTAQILKILCEKYHVKPDATFNVVEPLFRKMVFFVLEDAVLTPDEAQQVRHLKKIFGISDGKATSIIQTIGKSIYDLAKEEAESDGKISPEEREKLANLKRQLGLEVKVPEVGQVWSQIYEKAIALITQKITMLHDIRECLSTVLERRPDLEFHINFDFQFEHIDGLISSGKDCLFSLQKTKENDTERLNEILEMEDEIDIDVINELQEVLNNAIELSKGPVIDPSKEKEKEQRKYERERKQNEVRTKRAGYDPKGSPKQRAWVFDIIGRDWFGTDFGQKCERLLISQNGENDDDRHLLLWLNSLKQKPCGWWISKADDEMELVYGDAREKAKGRIYQRADR